jgi:hypothetical protein
MIKRIRIPEYQCRGITDPIDADPAPQGTENVPLIE